jgi:hypothetical protein
MSNPPEIAPCPFCHSPRTRLPLPGYGGWFFVECAVCDATGSTRPNAVEAVDVWNRVALACAALVALEAAYSALNGQFQSRIELINAIELHLDSPKWTHEEELSDDGFHIYCDGREAVRAMIADWRAAK